MLVQFLSHHQEQNEKPGHQSLYKMFSRIMSLFHLFLLKLLTEKTGLFKLPKYLMNESSRLEKLSSKKMAQYNAYLEMG